MFPEFQQEVKKKGSSVGAGGRTEASRPWGLGYQSTAPSRFP